jgi:protein SCO1/2
MATLSPLLRSVSLAVLAAGSSPLCAQWGHALPPVVDEAATMEDKLGGQADLDVRFVDEAGNPIHLADAVGGELPVVLNFGYFNCPGMCGFVLNQLLQNLPDSGLTPGEDFEFFTVSVHHDENPELAAKKKQTYVAALEAPAWTDSWPFLTGEQDQIRRLTGSVGWRFRFDDVAKDIDHPFTVVLLSPGGKVVRYLDTRQLTPKTLRRALIEAGDGQVGGFLESLLVTCYTFDPDTGAYKVTAMTVMRVGGVLTIFGLAAMIYVLWRRERARPRLATT